MKLAAVDQELDKLKAELADSNLVTEDQHPEIRALKDKIAETEKMRDQLLADLKTKDGNAARCQTGRACRGERGR